MIVTHDEILLGGQGGLQLKDEKDPVGIKMGKCGYSKTEDTASAKALS